jgi:Arc/MetJ family transcription regulator
MKTTIDIPEDELKEAIRHTGARTKKDAVVLALREFNRRQRLAKLATMLGTFKDFMTQDDLVVMREDKKWEKAK